jgi:hypothetical protein
VGAGSWETVAPQRQPGYACCPTVKMDKARLVLRLDDGKFPMLQGGVQPGLRDEEGSAPIRGPEEPGQPVWDVMCVAMIAI